jgi:hypothetical protein
MQADNRDKETKWTQSIAVGSRTFIEKMKESLGFRATGRKVICGDDTFELREAITPYGKANSLDSGNTFLWNQSIDRLRIYRQPPSLIGQFLHENRSIKTEILLFLGIFYSFFNMLPWPDPRTTSVGGRHGTFIYIYCGETLVTVLDAPPGLRNQSKKATTKKKQTKWTRKHYKKS